MIRHQMEETRSNLTEKLEALESQVAESVQSTTAAVSDTVEAVKETVENVSTAVQETVETVSTTVQETVDTVGQSFDLWGQTDRHPWVVFGGSVALGFMASQLFDRSSTNGHAKHRDSPSWDSLARSASHAREEASYKAPEPAARTTAHTESTSSSQNSWFWDQMKRLQGLAVGALMGVVRDLSARGLPGALGQRVAEEVDHLTSSLGAETISGPVLPPEK